MPKNTTTKPAPVVKSRMTLHPVKLGSLVTTTSQATALVSIFAGDASDLAFITDAIQWDGLTDDTIPAAPEERVTLAPTRAGRKVQRREVRDEYAGLFAEYMIKAENATEGVFLSEKGKRAGIDPASLVNTTEERFTRWASEEFARFIEGNPFPTFEEWSIASGIAGLFCAVA